MVANSQEIKFKLIMNIVPNGHSNYGTLASN